eukprot:scaffold309_cov136-Isochrysis_galbana.AAC.4
MSDPSRYPEIRMARFVYVYAMQWLPRPFAMIPSSQPIHLPGPFHPLQRPLLGSKTVTPL